MNARHDPCLDYDTPFLEPGMAVPLADFLDWVERQEGKYEYDRGTIGMMVKVTRNHSRLVARFVYLLQDALDDDAFEVHAEAFGVHTEGSIRFPDVLVQRPEPNGRALESKTPLLIVEVLSPSSVYADHVIKRDEYLTLPTLQAYVVADANVPKLTVWERSVGGGFPLAPLQLEGFERELIIDALKVSLPLRELYRGITG